MGGFDRFFALFKSPVWGTWGKKAWLEKWIF
jgi:hypothetical protein